MFVYFRLLVLRRFGQGASGFDEQFLPPADLMHSGIVDPRGPTESIDGSLSGLIVLPFDHLVDVPELIIDLLENDLVFVIEHSLVLFHFDVHMFYPLQLLL